MKEVLPNFQPGEHDRGVMTAPGHFPSSIYLRILNPNSK